MKKTFRKGDALRYLLVPNLIFLLSFLSTQSFAQNETRIIGFITDSTGSPINNIVVHALNSNQGTTTNESGFFALEQVALPAILEFSGLNYLTKNVNVSNSDTLHIVMYTSQSVLQEVIVVGYGTKKRESLTAAVSAVTSKDLENVHSGATVSTALAGKLPGVTFRLSDSRPGASASIQIRNMGDPLYIIDGIQQDAGQFNNIAPNDIESITVLKDASAAIYGVRAANGVVLITTKGGKLGSKNIISLNAYTGWQNWTRFPKTVNAYDWNVGKVEADMNQYGKTSITQTDLDKYKAGTEAGYQSFDWYKFIVKPNAPLTQMNLNFTGGSDKINYYVSATHLKQTSVLGREFTFERTNIQSNIDVKINNRLKIGARINGRVETRDNPGVPGTDDYWEARFAILRNTPMERPYANDNPDYPNNIGHNTENWALQTKKLSGYWHQDWRVLQTNLTAEYQTPINGLSIRGLFSYYYANQMLNGHEYTYDVYTYYPSDSTYRVTGGSSNPWRERTQETILSPTYQMQVDYKKQIGDHSINATFVAERLKRRDIYNWVHAVPTTNVLPLIYFNTMDTYNDADNTQARIGYVGRLNYNYKEKYYVEIAGRRDASYIFPPDHRWGTFPSVSLGWRLTQEPFFQNLVSPAIISELKLRASYGLMGSDADVPIDPYAYYEAYNYNSSTTILDGQAVIGSSYRGVPTTNVSWYKSKILDIGMDFGLLNNKLNGSIDYFNRKRTGLLDRKYDVLVPSELGYSLPYENLNSDGVIGGELALNYSGKINNVNFSVGGNFSYARAKDISRYKPMFYNSYDQYRTSAVNRWSNIYWGLEYIGQFNSQEEINSYPVNVDGQNNKTLLPGDLKYKDQNGDGVIDDKDNVPLGWGTGRNPVMNFGFNFSTAYKGFDLHIDLSGATGYSFERNYEMRWPYQNGGALQKVFYESRWHRTDPYDLNSEWIAGEYPSLRFNDAGHSNYRNSSFWLTNATYLRVRTIALGYTLPKNILEKIKFQKVRFYINASNPFSFDNLKRFGVDPEISDNNGLTYPQSKYLNAGIELTF